MNGVKKPSARMTSKRSHARTSAADVGSVPAYISALPPAHRTVAQRFDTLVGSAFPDVQRTLKWKMPFYGRKGAGWFASCGVIRGEVRVTFFQGRKLRPVPPEGSGQLRGIRIGSPGAFDSKRIASWVRQAAKLPGFGS